MNLPELVEAMKAAGVEVSLALKVKAPPGAIDDALRAAIAEYKPYLLERLGREALWERLQDQRWGPALDPLAEDVIPPARAGPRQPGDDDHEATSAGWLREFNRGLGRGPRPGAGDPT